MPSERIIEVFLLGYSLFITAAFNTTVAHYVYVIQIFEDLIQYLYDTTHFFIL